MCFHHFNNSSLNGISPVIFYLALHLGSLSFLRGLRAKDRDLVPIQIALILQVHEELVLSGERMDSRLLCQDFVLNEWDQMQVDFLSLDLSDLEDLLVCQGLMLVEQEQ